MSVFFLDTSLLDSLDMFNIYFLITFTKNGHTYFLSNSQFKQELRTEKRINLPHSDKYLAWDAFHLSVETSLEKNMRRNKIAYTCSPNTGPDARCVSRESSIRTILQIYK